jgi:hypothetical protein
MTLSWRGPSSSPNENAPSMADLLEIQAGESSESAAEFLDWEDFYWPILLFLVTFGIFVGLMIASVLGLQ